MPGGFDQADDGLAVGDLVGENQHIAIERLAAAQPARRDIVKRRRYPRIASKALAQSNGGAKAAGPAYAAVAMARERHDRGQYQLAAKIWPDALDDGVLTLERHREHDDVADRGCLQIAGPACGRVSRAAPQRFRRWLEPWPARATRSPPYSRPPPSVAPGPSRARPVPPINAIVGLSARRQRLLGDRFPARRPPSSEVHAPPPALPNLRGPLPSKHGRSSSSQAMARGQLLLAIYEGPGTEITQRKRREQR